MSTVACASRITGVAWIAATRTVGKLTIARAYIQRGPLGGRSTLMSVGLSNPTHILLIALVIVLLFGAKRLPEIGRQLGRGIREVKEHTGLDEITSTPKELRAAITDPVTKASAPSETAAVERDPAAS